MLPDESVEEFRAIYKKYYGEDISADDAREMARRLLMLYEILAKSIPGESHQHRGSRRPSSTSSR